MKIGLDFDGVFCNVSQLLRNGAEQLFGVDLPEDKTTEEFALGERFLNKKQFNELKNFVFEKTAMDSKAVPIKGAGLACRSLIQRGHQLQIVTKRKPGAKIIKGVFNILGIDIPVVGMKSNQPKSSVSDGLDLFLDDSPKVLEELRGAVPNLFLFSWGYNLATETPFAERVNSWEDFARRIS